MASLNDRAAGQDFEGNGPSSFDRRDYREAAESMDLTPRIPGAEKAVAEAMAQIERAFGKWDRETGRRVPHASVVGEAA